MSAIAIASTHNVTADSITQSDTQEESFTVLYTSQCP
jgi:hypothetical protein